MKKKHRDIIVDGIHYGWQFYSQQDYEGCQILKIWKERKLVFEKGYLFNKKKYSIKPGLIARFIKKHFK